MIENFSDRSLLNTSEGENGLRQNPEDGGFVPPYLWEEIQRREAKDPASGGSFIQMPDAGKEEPDQRNFISHGAGNADREVYDAQGLMLEVGEFGKKARFEGEPPVRNSDVDKVYDYTGEVRRFYEEQFGRNSIDNNGQKFISRVNYGHNFQNAYWDGVEMTYGKPEESSPFKTFVLLDVTAHEITHGITETESGLALGGQSGALNESLSDVFAELVKQWSKHQTADQASWVVGEGAWKPSIHGRGLRDMLHPGTAYDDPVIGKDRQPADMDHYVRTWSDNGGVHINSSIPNRAFAEFAVAAGGYAWEKPGHIWYQARKIAGSYPDFAQFAAATIKAAHDLGYDGELPKLENAWKKVGVSPASGDEAAKIEPGSANDQLLRQTLAQTKQELGHLEGRGGKEICLPSVNLDDVPGNKYKPVGESKLARVKAYAAA